MEESNDIDISYLHLPLADSLLIFVYIRGESPRPEMENTYRRITTFWNFISLIFFNHVHNTSGFDSG